MDNNGEQMEEAKKMVIRLAQKQESMAQYEIEKISECLTHTMGTPPGLGLSLIDSWVADVTALQRVSRTSHALLLSQLSRAKIALQTGTRMTNREKNQWSDWTHLAMRQAMTMARQTHQTAQE